MAERRVAEIVRERQCFGGAIGAERNCVLIRNRRHGRRDAVRVALDRRAVRRRERAVVLEQPFERFPGEIETVEGGVAPFERGNDSQRLGVMVEAAGLCEAAIERAICWTSNVCVSRVR